MGLAALRMVQLLQQPQPGQQHPIQLNISSVNQSTGLDVLQLPMFDYGTFNDQKNWLENIFTSVSTDQISISGKEAVLFLRKSNLSNDDLRHVWEVAAKGNVVLNRTGFYHAMRLVAKMQMSGSGSGVVSVEEGEYLPLPTLD